MESPTRGLDSSTALEYMRALRLATDTGRLTTIVSLYQAGEKLFELVDKVSRAMRVFKMMVAEP